MKKFVEENQEALVSLSRAVKELESIRNVKDETELLGRQYAIEIVEGWLNEIFNIQNKDLFPLLEEEEFPIVNYHDKVERDK